MLTDVTPELLAQAIAAHRAAGGDAISRLGYFTKPFRVAEGPLGGLVVKRYRAPGDAALLDRMARAHDAYVALLADAGVPVPDTGFHLIDGAPVVVQDGLPDASMMRPLMQDATRDEAIRYCDAAGSVIARFWHHVTDHPERVGFHPSIRNFAIVEDEAIFFDTFPPLIGYSRDEMGRLLLTFSESALMRGVGPFIKGRVTAIQDEWYSPAGTLVGLVGSACRLRPDDAEAFLDWGRGFANQHMAPWAEEAVAEMQEPPRLSGLWTGMRRAMGLVGEPNLKSGQ
ncbi:DUF6206 family protein [Pseudaestuariivita atlantica]|uniref:Aminoglycoside phosphotransferase domain-containing protein n=1 Tax=Pseudaestuariivita atlantica TaxID=1317121 RepID=A0A0L1JR28_9RHOB|nr:DUF6206 family protein [Pseudaestuariivita atlantica]KNG94190.1 hypothetical protein ATO11_08175 [Pseudaestuariivita atlantica]